MPAKLTSSKNKIAPVNHIAETKPAPVEPKRTDASYLIYKRSDALAQLSYAYAVLHPAIEKKLAELIRPRNSQYRRVQVSYEISWYAHEIARMEALATHCEELFEMWPKWDGLVPSQIGFGEPEVVRVHSNDQLLSLLARHRDRLQEECMRALKSPPASTSVSSNLVQVASNSAKAEFIEILTSIIGVLE